MADEGSSGIQNKKLLFVAILLGLIVVVIYNVHIANVKNTLVGPQVKVLKFKRQLTPGQTITEQDIEEVAIPVDAVMDDVVKADDKGFVFSSGKEANVLRAARKGDFVRYAHVQQQVGDTPSSYIPAGDNVGLTIEVNQQTTPGAFLRVGDRVNLVGVFPFGASAKSVRIINGVVVRAIGGRAAGDFKVGKSGSEEGMTSYRNITIDVPKDKNRDVALQLRNVLTYAIGGISLEVCSPSSHRPDLAVNDELGDMRFKAKASSKSSATPPPEPSPGE